MVQMRGGRVGGAIVLLIALIVPVALPPASGFDYSGWEKVRYVEIRNPYNALVDHQVLVSINTKKLIDNGLMRPDCGDLRFSDLDGNPLPYWIESGCGSFDTKVWVRVPRIEPGDNRILMYYGNPLAESESDEVATMDRAVTYGGGSYDEFFAMASDGENIYLAGYTLSTGFGGYDGLIVKFDEELNPVKAKVYGGFSYDGFYGAYSDGEYVYAGGFTYSEGAGGYDAMVVKFDRDLNVVAKKVIGNRNHDWFYEITGDDQYLYAVGYTLSAGLGDYDAYIVKMDKDLNVIGVRALGSTSYEGFHYVTTSGDYVYAVGVTTSGFGQEDGLICKFDKDLNLVSAKVYGGSDYDFFFGVTALGDYIYVAGYVDSAGSGGHDGLLVKFDSDLDLMGQKAYGGSADDGFATLRSYEGQIYVVGFADSEGRGGRDSVVLKVDPDLNLIAARRYGGSGNEWMNEITGLNGYIYLGGFTDTIGSGGLDAMVTRIYKLFNQVSVDPAFTFANSSLTYQDISLSITDSTLTLVTPAFIIRDSSLRERDASLTLSRTFLRKIPDLTGYLGPEVSEEEGPTKRIRTPDPGRMHCVLSLSGFPESHYYVTTLSDFRFNEDILSRMSGYIMNVNWSSGVYRGPFLYVGGPDKIPFPWVTYGVTFLKEGGKGYTALEYQGKVYRASPGYEDYAVVLVDCSTKNVRVAGITEYGTRAGLIWAVNYVKDLGYDGLFLVRWVDGNRNGLVESFELTAVRR